MKRNISIQDWKLSWIENAVVVKNGICIKTPNDLKGGEYPIIKATVPGNFELDFMREGLLDDVYMGANNVKTQKLENLHLYYFTEFDYISKAGYDSVLCFEGVDTAAEIYLDGDLLGFVENMLHAHRFNINGLQDGINFEKTGVIWEKYDGRDGSIAVTNEYETPEMLGWSAGVYRFFVEDMKL